MKKKRFQISGDRFGFLHEKKLKRRIIHKKYAKEVEAMYAATLAPPPIAAGAEDERSAG